MLRRSLMTLSIVLALSAVTGVRQAQAELAIGASAEEAEVTVGCLFPLNGRGGLYGKDSAVGIRLAFEWLAQQESDYPKMRVLIEDSRSKPSRATRLVRDFVHNEGARFICGVVNSSIAWQVSQVAQAEKAFFIGTDHGSSRLTDGEVSPYYFRLNNNSRQSMEAAAAYIRDRFSNSQRRTLRISYLGPDYDYGYSMLADLRRSLTDVGVRYELVTTLWPRLYEPDYTPHIQALIEQPTDLIVNSLWGGDLVAFIQQANKTELFDHAPFANFDTGGNYEVLSALGQDMPNGLILAARHHNNWPDTPYNRWFTRRFFELSGRYPSYAAEGAYAGILAIAETARQAGPDASDEMIRQTLEQLKLKLPEDPTGFTSYMDAETHQIQQVISIGVSAPDTSLPPATHLLTDWKSYAPDALKQPR
ncbi:ABC transporter substrate-binding protein [Marinobacterium lutimaris]|uniref:ABC transporter substrate-binding protein n=1 Tax=Marinobacterium lutimaris TaxID=568106 RepID=UPI001F1DA37C|nr:ABC transporter substrate-binding protein [Marinobacterium lutimaris]